MKNEITSGEVTYYEAYLHLKNYLIFFRRCFKKEARHHLFDARNIENLEICAHLHKFLDAYYYRSAIAYLIRCTRMRQVLSQEDELFRAEKESEWVCFLRDAEECMTRNRVRIAYLARIRDRLIENKAWTFPLDAEASVKELHLELRVLFLSKNEGIALEGVRRLILGYYKDDIKDREKTFTFPIGSNEPPIPSVPMIPSRSDSHIR